MKSTTTTRVTICCAEWATAELIDAPASFSQRELHLRSGEPFQFVWARGRRRILSQYTAKKLNPSKKKEAVAAGSSLDGLLHRESKAKRGVQEAYQRDLREGQQRLPTHVAAEVARPVHCTEVLHYVMRLQEGLSEHHPPVHGLERSPRRQQMLRHPKMKKHTPRLDAMTSRTLGSIGECAA